MLIVPYQMLLNPASSKQTINISMTKRILTLAVCFTTKYLTAHINSLKLAWLACNNIPLQSYPNFTHYNKVMSNIKLYFINPWEEICPLNWSHLTSTTLECQEHYLTCMYFRATETQVYEETHADTGRTCKVHAEKPQLILAQKHWAVTRQSCPADKCPIKQHVSLHSLIFSFPRRNNLT